MITPQFTILIAERNRNVRDFLRRELVADGYRVVTARDGREVLQLLKINQTPDLVILDLEIPLVSGLEVLMQLQDEHPGVPVLVHTFLTEYANHPAVQNAAGFLEKSGNNLEGLKATLAQLLSKAYPDRSPPRGRQWTESERPHRAGTQEIGET